MYGRNQADHGLLCTPDLVYCFFEFVSYTFQKESVKYMKCMGEIKLITDFFALQI